MNMDPVAGDLFRMLLLLSVQRWSTVGAGTVGECELSYKTCVGNLEWVFSLLVGICSGVVACF